MNEFMQNLIQNSLLTSVIVLLLVVLSKFLREKTSPRLRVICWIIVAAAFLIPIRPALILLPGKDFTPAINEMLTQNAPAQEETSQPDTETNRYEQNLTTGQIKVSISPDDTMQPYQTIIAKIDGSTLFVAETDGHFVSFTPEEIHENQPLVLPPWQMVVFCVWLIGFIVFLSHLIISQVRLTRKFKKRSNNITDIKTIEFLGSILNDIKLKRSIRIRTCSLIKTPVTFGLFKPVILLPEETIDDKELRFMLMHEALHIKHVDLWSKAITLLAMSMHWFNPAVYILNRFIDTEMELTCDAAVLKYSGEEERLQYGKTVFHAAKQNLQQVPTLTSAFSGSGKNLKFRLSAIINRKNTRRWVVVCCTSLLVLCITIAGLAGCRHNNEGIVDAKVDLTPTDELIIYAPGYEYYNSRFWDAVDLYKQENKNIDLTVERIGGRSRSSLEQYQTRLVTELMAGKGPDIIFTQYFTDIHKTIETGAFLNLNEIIEQDEDINFDDYYKIVMDAGIYKSGRYIIPLSFNIPIMLSERGMLDTIGFDLSKNTDFSSFIREAVEKMPYAREINPTGSIMQTYAGLISRDISEYSWFPRLHWGLLRISGIPLADFENDIVLPDEENFRALCEAYKSYYEYDMSSLYEYTSPIDAFTAGVVFFDDTPISSEHFFSWGRLKSEGYEPMFTYIKDSNGGHHATVAQGVAIRAGSKNQLNAWNFIKLLLSEDIQYGAPGSPAAWAFDGLAVNKNAVSRSAEFFSRSRSVGFSDGTFTIPPVPDEDRQQFKDLINSITSCSFENYSLFTDFFWECMEPYFNGDQTYDEAVEQLKQRLRFYISE